jgi:hypothetical protein
MNHSEIVAKIVVESVIAGAQMVFRPDQSQSVPDFDLHYPNGRIVAAEVTACVDQQGEETFAAIKNPKKGGMRIKATLCKKDWRIHPARDARINAIRKKADGYLAAVEAEGVERFFSSRDSARSPSVEHIYKDLRVLAGSVIEWQQPGYISIALPVVGGAVGASLVLDAVKIDAFKNDNRTKLGNAGTEERHLLVYMDHSNYLARSAFQDFEPPSVLPELPAEITHVWMFSENLENDAYVIWRASTVSPWQRIADLAMTGQTRAV